MYSITINHINVINIIYINANLYSALRKQYILSTAFYIWHCLREKLFWNKRFLDAFWKFCSFLFLFMCSSNWFQRVGPFTLKDLAANVCPEVLGISSCLSLLAWIPVFFTSWVQQVPLGSWGQVHGYIWILVLQFSSWFYVVLATNAVLLGTLRSFHVYFFPLLFLLLYPALLVVDLCWFWVIQLVCCLHSPGVTQTV